TPGDPSLDRDFKSAISDTVADRDGFGTGFADVQANGAGDEYLAGNLRLAMAGQGTLDIKTTAGTNEDIVDTHKNELQSSFDGTRSAFRVQTRVVGPLTTMKKPGQQQSVFFGPDADNFVKLSIEFNGGALNFTLWFEQDGVGKIVTGRQVVPV